MTRHPPLSQPEFMQGLRSLLIGAHQFLLHPIALIRAWGRLYGPVRDPRIVLSIFLHDIGYAFTPNMDGPEGERHVEAGAVLMTLLCDPPSRRQPLSTPWGVLTLGPWGRFTLLHSRFYAAHLGLSPSRLCAADKLAMTLEPFYVQRVRLSGEVWEYLAMARAGRYGHLDLPEGTGIDVIRCWAKLTSNRMSAWATLNAPTLTPEPSALLRTSP